MTVALAVFAAGLVLTLLLALVSSLTHRTILSTAALCLVAGFLLGRGTSNVMTPWSPGVQTVAEVALFAVVFIYGLRAGWAGLRGVRKPPGRALRWGLPVMVTITVLLAHFVAGFGWPASLLAGVIVVPADPAFARALVNNERVPAGLRRMVKLETGASGGLALPFALVIGAITVSAVGIGIGGLAIGLVGGAVIGVALPWLVTRVERVRFFAAVTRYEAVYEPVIIGVIGLLVLVAGKVAHANLPLAAFAAGVTIATTGHRRRPALARMGEMVINRIGLAAVLAFGALLSLDILAGIGATVWAVAILLLLAVRPVALMAAFWRSGLPAGDRIGAMWLGPKGGALVLLGLVLLHSGAPAAGPVFNLLAATIIVFVLAHAGTDLLIAWRFPDARTGSGPGFRRQASTK